MTGQMLTRGTATKSKDQIDAQVDFIGASLSSSGNTVSADFLSKYTDQMMELFAEVIQNPSFNDEEFQKLKRQTISSLKSNKSVGWAHRFVGPPQLLPAVLRTEQRIHGVGGRY